METHKEFDEVFRTYYKPLYFFARQYVDDVVRRLQQFFDRSVHFDTFTILLFPHIDHSP